MTSASDRSELVNPAALGITLWDKIGDAVVVAHVESARVVLCNPAAERLFGYSTEEAIGMPIELLVPEHIRRYHVAGFARFQATDHADSFSATHPSNLTILTKDGQCLERKGVLARLGGQPPNRLVMAIFHQSA